MYTYTKECFVGFRVTCSGVAKDGPSRARPDQSSECGALPNDAQMPASVHVYSKYMYLQINHLFLHEKALTVAQKQ